MLNPGYKLNPVITYAFPCGVSAADFRRSHHQSRAIHSVHVLHHSEHCCQLLHLLSLWLNLSNVNIDATEESRRTKNF